MPAAMRPAKRCGENVAGIENGDTGCDFLAGVEDGEHVEGTRVVGGFGDAEEETCKEETSEVCGEGGKGGDNRPECHAASHVVGGFRTGEEHV